MKQILENIMKKPGRVNTCVVVKKVSPNVYAVRDELDRIFNAESVAVWSVGDSVVVSNNIIIGRAVQQETIQQFEV
jgi:hypothetical protein